MLWLTDMAQRAYSVTYAGYRGLRTAFGRRYPGRTSTVRYSANKASDTTK